MTRIVTVDGDPEIAAVVAASLPPRWLARRGSPAWVDAIVLVRPDTARVSRTRAEYPTTPILVLVDAEAPAAEVVAILEAGANVCVRDCRPELVGDELRACSGNAPRRWHAA